MPAALAALLAALALAGAHAADARAATCSAPAIAGGEEVGATLTAEAGGCTDPLPPDVRLEWYRCTGATPASCTTRVKAAQPSPSSYTATAADAGSQLGVKQTATRAGLLAEEDWAFTGAIAQPPGGDPGSGPGGGGTGGGPGDGGQQAAPLLSPFPVVLIAGRLTRRGAVVRRLTVRGPRGATVRARCRGRGCPAGAARRKIGRKRAVRMRRFERRLRYGSVLELTITKPGFVGRYTSFRFRRGRSPVRTDLCVQPGATTPSACP